MKSDLDIWMLLLILLLLHLSLYSATENCGKRGSPKIRLVDRNNVETKMTGRLDIFDEETKTWQSVCSYNFYAPLPALACKRICATPSEENPAFQTSGFFTTSVPYYAVNCPNSAKEFSDCSINKLSTLSSDIQIQCSRWKNTFLQCLTPTEPPPVSSDLIGNVKCDDNIVTVDFDVSKNPGLKQRNIHLLNSDKHNCLFKVTKEGNKIVAKFSLTQCGAKLDFTSEATKFTNTLIRKYDLFEGRVMTHSDVYMDVICILTKSNEVSSGPVSGSNMTGASMSGTDRPSVELKVFTDDKYRKELPRGGKIIIKQSTRLYVRVRETSAVPNTRFTVRSCWLTPEENRNSKKRFDVIVDGCLHSYYIKKLSQVNDMTQKIVMRPVSFHGYNHIYFNCDTKTCAKSDRSNVCHRRCTKKNAFSDRKR